MRILIWGEKALRASAILCANCLSLSIALAACGTRASTTPAITADSLAQEAVAALSRRDLDSLATLVHPTKGIRFTPYTRVDTTSDRRFSPEQLRAQWLRPDSLLWGSFDGTGDPIRLSFRQYVDKFVYDFDVARAPRVVRDSAPMGTGNSIYNLREVYPESAIVEFNTPGTDPRYGGMDWRSLWIVMERVEDRWTVVGIVHGSWTI
jgi:hypothetical protein